MPFEITRIIYPMVTEFQIPVIPTNYGRELDTNKYLGGGDRNPFGKDFKEAGKVSCVTLRYQFFSSNKLLKKLEYFSQYNILYICLQFNLKFETYMLRNGQWNCAERIRMEMEKQMEKS